MSGPPSAGAAAAAHEAGRQEGSRGRGRGPRRSVGMGLCLCTHRQRQNMSVPLTEKKTDVPGPQFGQASVLPRATRGSAKWFHSRRSPRERFLEIVFAQVSEGAHGQGMGGMERRAPVHGREVRRVGLDQRPGRGAILAASRTGSALPTTVPAGARGPRQARRTPRRRRSSASPTARAHPRRRSPSARRRGRRGPADHQGSCPALGPARCGDGTAPPARAFGAGWAVEPGCPPPCRGPPRRILGDRRIEVAVALVGGARPRPRGRRTSPPPRPPRRAAEARSRSARWGPADAGEAGASASSTGRGPSAAHVEVEWLSTDGCGSGPVAAGGRSCDGASPGPGSRRRGRPRLGGIQWLTPSEDHEVERGGRSAQRSTGDALAATHHVRPHQRRRHVHRIGDGLLVGVGMARYQFSRRSARRTRRSPRGTARRPRGHAAVA